MAKSGPKDRPLDLGAQRISITPSGGRSGAQASAGGCAQYAASALSIIPSGGRSSATEAGSRRSPAVVWLTPVPGGARDE